MIASEAKASILPWRDTLNSATTPEATFAALLAGASKLSLGFSPDRDGCRRRTGWRYPAAGRASRDIRLTVTCGSGGLGQVAATLARCFAAALQLLWLTGSLAAARDAKASTPPVSCGTRRSRLLSQIARAGLPQGSSAEKSVAVKSASEPVLRFFLDDIFRRNDIERHQLSGHRAERITPGKHKHQRQRSDR